MVTGDNIQTAKAIALECGILSSAEDATEPTIIEGRVFRELSDKEREQISKKITVSFGYNFLIIFPSDPDNFSQANLHSSFKHENVVNWECSVGNGEIFSKRQAFACSSLT